jgi:hypothetical protein
VERLSDLIGCPIDLITVGKHRRQSIAVNGLFQKLGSGA